MDERERFAAQLRAQGQDEATVEAYLRIAERVTGIAGGWSVRPTHVDEAVRRAEAEGAGVKQLANLKRVGDALVAFARASRPPPSMQSAPPPSVASAAPHAGDNRCPACGGMFAPVAFGENAGAAGGIGGLVGAGAGFFIVRLFGCVLPIAIALAVGAAISAYRAIATRATCSRCDRVAQRHEVDTLVRDELDTTRRKAWMGAAGMGALAVVMFGLWIAVLAALVANDTQ